jgi:hypothetical protein
VLPSDRRCLFLLRAHDRAGLSPNAEQVLNDYSFPQNNRELEMLLSRAIAQAGKCAPDEETIIQPDLLWSTQWTAEFYRRLFNLFKNYPALWMLSRSNNWLERFNDFIFAPGFVLFNALLLLGPQTRDQLPALSISWNCALPHDCTFPKLGLEYTYSSDMHACLQFNPVAGETSLK